MIIDSCVWVAAADPHDHHHRESRAFLQQVAQSRAKVSVPAHALIEVACALARRLGSANQGHSLAQDLFKALRSRQIPLDAALLSLSLQLGTTHLLRSGDALFVATAQLKSEPLLTWDQELIKKKLAHPPRL